MEYPLLYNHVRSNFSLELLHCFRKNAFPECSVITLKIGNVSIEITASLSYLITLTLRRDFRLQSYLSKKYFAIRKINDKLLLHLD